MGQGEFHFSPPTNPPVSSQPPDPGNRENAKNVPVDDAKKLLPEVYSVTQLTRLIKITLTGHLPATIVLTGEISNFTPHRSGHLYLTLKDENAQISAVMWHGAAARLKFQPADGLAVRAVGRVDVYEPQGKYQFYIDKLEPAGIGALELAFRQLAEKLRREGLFDEARKKPIPAYPETIALVTSPEGAALEDITKTLNRRFPIVRKLLYPVAVQGENAALEIARAIRRLNRRRTALGGIDLIILARGGGSLEDLWAFNEEIVARAIFQSDIPILTGIGHEVDTTIADLVADRRAATPTAAAELAVPVRDDLLQHLFNIKQRLAYIVHHRAETAGRTLENLAHRPLFFRSFDLVRHRQQFIDEQSARLAQRLGELLRRAVRTLQARTAILRRIEPRYVLNQARIRLIEHRHLLHLTLQQFCRGQKHRLENTGIKLQAAAPRRRIPQQRLVLDHGTVRLKKAPQILLSSYRQQLDHTRLRLQSLNPGNVLNRGYSITRVKKTRKIITPHTALKPGDILITELAQKTLLESKVTLRPPPRKDNHD